MHQPAGHAHPHDQHVDEQRHRRSLSPTLWSHDHPGQSQRAGKGSSEPQSKRQASPPEQVRPDAPDDPNHTSWRRAHGTIWLRTYR